MRGGSQQESIEKIHAESEVKIMILTYYESHGGGVNNLAVALDEASGIRATSTKGKEAAIRNLKRSRKYKAYCIEIGKQICDAVGTSVSRESVSNLCAFFRGGTKK